MANQSKVFSNGQHSIFGEILDWMFAPLLLLWPMSIVITWLVAKTIANHPFDQALEQHLQTLSQQIQSADGKPALSATMLGKLSLADELDFRYVQLRGADGKVHAGDADLPAPLDEDNKSFGNIQFRNTQMHGHNIRLAYMWLPAAGDGNKAGALLQIGETLGKRARLANEIVKGVILPQFIILPLALFLVWLALSRGLSPLSVLQQKIRSRQPDDMSPIHSTQIPEEIAPLVQSLNEMLARLTFSITQQKRFIADAAHQMKTPLAGMQMQAELALRDADAKNLPEVQRSLLQLAASSERATHLVNQLLALARAENQARHGALWHAVDLLDLARQCMQDWVPHALARKIDLGFEQETELACVKGQATLLRELINNLLDNALRYTPQGGIVTLRIKREQVEENAQIVLQVEDDGPGIAPAERPLVFERFYRVLGNQAQGSGLGLAIVREIALQHGASISLSDNPNCHTLASASQGCRFTLCFAAFDSQQENP